MLFLPYDELPPPEGVVVGAWDLRGRERDYLGGVDVAGKAVLEIGTASGYLCFWMENQGAQVTAYDLSESYDWDIVPYSDRDISQFVQDRRSHIRQINNSWWFAHERLHSNARVAYGTAYDVSEKLGRFDIVSLSCILLHLRDPFLAIQRAASVAVDTIIVTDWPPSQGGSLLLPNNGRVLRFLPDARTGEPSETWWQLAPEFIAEALRVLGFSDLAITHHQQRCRGNEIRLFTIVARRRSAREQPLDALEGMEGVADSYKLHNEILKQIPARHLLRHLAGRAWRKFT